MFILIGAFLVEWESQIQFWEFSGVNFVTVPLFLSCLLE